jgi:hypothetical protein
MKFRDSRRVKRPGRTLSFEDQRCRHRRGARAEREQSGPNGGPPLVISVENPGWDCSRSDLRNLNLSSFQ